jgi:hypothetical protein
MDTAQVAKQIFMFSLDEVLAAVLYPALSCKPKPAGPDAVIPSRLRASDAVLI